jgi:hypothetical protein
MVKLCHKKLLQKLGPTQNFLIHEVGAAENRPIPNTDNILPEQPGLKPVHLAVDPLSDPLLSSLL